ncbi:MAG: succinate dehydrogenase assembly factor 2 [Dokdonella sp.]
MSVELSRLRWRCRRGTRELDQMLGGWLERAYPTASLDTRAAFASLLEQQDPDLWDWLLGNAKAPDPRQQVLIDEIRADHRL